MIVITILIRSCYVGYDRGLLAEALHLAGLVVVTCLSMNFSAATIGWFQTLLPWQGAIFPVLIFWGLFLTLLSAVRYMNLAFTRTVKWDRLHWTIQGLGTFLGAARGLWWSGIFLIALSGSGMTYLQESAEQRAVLGSRLLPITRAGIEAAASRMPGGGQRTGALIPPLQ